MFGHHATLMHLYGSKENFTEFTRKEEVGFMTNYVFSNVIEGMFTLWTRKSLWELGIGRWKKLFLMQ